MEKEKQIDEMAKYITVTMSFLKGEYIEDKDFLGLAIGLHDDGYRKASDTAREIFEAFRAAMRAEIERNENYLPFAEDDCDFYEGRNDAYRTAINCLAELKKKYESEKDDG